MHWSLWVLVGVGITALIGGLCCLLIFGTFLTQDSYVVRGVRHPGKNYVPKKVFQTWKSEDQLIPYQKRSRESVKQLYPDHEYKLWSDADIEAFVTAEYPEFHEDTWQRMTPFIKKIDCWRYMLLYKQGGIYFDIDVIVKRNMEHLFDVPGAAYVPAQNPWMLWRNGADAASPAIIASAPGNRFWLEMLEHIRMHHTKEYLKDHPNEEVLAATGPIAVAQALKKFKREGTDPLVLLSETRLGIGQLKSLSYYSYHENQHDVTWRAPDAKK